MNLIDAAFTANQQYGAYIVANQILHTPMVEVFKTNVQESEHAKQLIDLLLQQFPGSKINFDLDDCDKVLRIEGNNFVTCKVIMFVKETGFICNVLE
ncbi:MAG: hypothetical protein ABI861_01850 [Panacibacter sp.]